MAIAEDVPSASVRDIGHHCVQSLRDRPVEQLRSSLELLDVHDHHIACSCHSDIEDTVVLCQHRLICRLELFGCLDLITDHVRHVLSCAIDPRSKSDINLRIRILGRRFILMYYMHAVGLTLDGVLDISHIRIERHQDDVLPLKTLR